MDTTINEVGFHMVKDPANDTGFTDDDQYTKNRNPQFKWTCDEDLTVTISVYDENGDLVNEYTEASPAGENTWTVPGGAPLIDGDYTVTATFTDAAGNVLSQDINGDPIESVDLTVDTLAPALTVGLTDGSDSGTKGDWLTNDEAVTAGLHLTGDGENASRIYVYVNDMLTPVTDPGLGQGLPGRQRRHLDLRPVPPWTSAPASTRATTPSWWWPRIRRATRPCSRIPWRSTAK